MSALGPIRSLANYGEAFGSLVLTPLAFYSESKGVLKGIVVGSSKFIQGVSQETKYLINY